MTTAAQHKKYANPPIVEAVVDFVIDQRESLDNGAFERLKDAYSKLGYTDYVPINYSLVRFQIGKTKHDVKEQPDIPDPPKGAAYRRPDKSRIVQAKSDGFTFSMLKPYLGWEVMQPEAVTAFELYARELDRPRIKRVGVRYINRICIPKEETEKGFAITKYLRTLPDMSADSPEGGAVSSYAMQLEMPQKDINGYCLFKQQLGKFEDQVSITIDIDVIRDNDLPEDYESLWEIVEKLHDRENEIFESSITKNSRGLFV